MFVLFIIIHYNTFYIYGTSIWSGELNSIPNWNLWKWKWSFNDGKHIVPAILFATPASIDAIAIFSNKFIDIFPFNISLHSFNNISALAACYNDISVFLTEIDDSMAWQQMSKYIDLF